MEKLDVRSLAVDVYQYAYPLVVMDLTRRQMTNVPDAHTVSMRAPVNQFAHVRAHPSGEAREVVRFNFDTLYSFAWLDVGDEPVIVSVPEEKERYYLVPMLDMWTDVFAVPGTRTTGGHAGDFAVAAPGWEGELPDGVELLRAPTPLVWIMGRTQANGPADYPNVHPFQDSFRLTPLSRWGHAYSPPAEVATDPNVDEVTPPVVQANSMTGMEFFTRFARLLKTHPPHFNDHP
ncbi:MAG: DUF1254 domain-containing protein, partial [Streptosporangiaceae bacterium]